MDPVAANTCSKCEVVRRKLVKLWEDYQVLLKKDEYSKGLIQNVSNENVQLKEKFAQLEHEYKELKRSDRDKKDEVSSKKVEQLEQKMKELKTREQEIRRAQNMQLEKRIMGLVAEKNLFESEKDRLLQLNTDLQNGFKTQKRSLDNRIRGLVNDCNEVKKKCRALESRLSEQRNHFQSKCLENKELKEKILEIDPEVSKRMEVEITSLETKLNEQKEFVLGQEVHNIIDNMKQAHEEVISGIENAHNLEKLTMRKEQEELVLARDVQINNLKEALRQVIAVMENAHNLEKLTISNEQKELVLARDMQIDNLKEAQKQVIADMKEAHSLEILAIRNDQENKGQILLDLQTKIEELEAQVYMLLST